jgi:microcompartment protein CcmL/EutN
VAVEAGVQEARRVGRVYNSTVLPQPYEEVHAMLDQHNGLHLVERWRKPEVARAVPVDSEEHQAQSQSEERTADPVDYASVPVHELRRLVRKLPESELTGSAISRANRQQLIELLKRFSGREEGVDGGEH